jgi:hypothetical protein
MITIKLFTGEVECTDPIEAATFWQEYVRLLSAAVAALPKNEQVADVVADVVRKFGKAAKV